MPDQKHLIKLHKEKQDRLLQKPSFFFQITIHSGPAYQLYEETEYDYVEGMKRAYTLTWENPDKQFGVLRCEDGKKELVYGPHLPLPTVDELDKLIAWKKLTGVP